MEESTNKFYFSEEQRKKLLQLFDEKIQKISFGSQSHPDSIVESFIRPPSEGLFEAFSAQTHSLFKRLSPVDDGIVHLQRRRIVFPDIEPKNGVMQPGKEYFLHFFRELDLSQRKTTVSISEYWRIINEELLGVKKFIHVTIDELETLATLFRVSYFTLSGSVFLLSNKYPNEILFIAPTLNQDIFRTKDGSPLLRDHIFMCVTEAY